MRIDFVSFSFRTFDGYGRYSSHTIAALQKLGCDVMPLFPEHVNMPMWMKQQVGIGKDIFTISCLPPYLLQKSPSGGRHWLLSMTEGSDLPLGWADEINASDVERVIVPCEANAQTFRDGGVKVPVHVIPGGTSPEEFPVITARRRDPHYTFLALGDRGARKGWTEVYSAFFKAFGTPEETPNVRLIIKCRPGGNELLDVLANVAGLDPRIEIRIKDQDMRQLYAEVDCVAIPSRSEGWGMPMREASMSGLPVIVQQHSGLDDGYTDQWAIALTKGHTEPIPKRMGHIKGTWTGADIPELTQAMRWCFDNPLDASKKGQQAAEWLRVNQTWQHSATKLLELIQEHS